MSVASQPTAMQPPRRWFRRNWKWFLPGMFVVAFAMAAIAVFSYVQVRSYRHRQNPAYQLSLATVQDSDKIRERLGEPIEDSDWNPFGRVEPSTGHGTFIFTVSGPKGHADVATQAHTVKGEWAVNRLEVRFPEGDVINITEEALANQQVDTPAFDPNKAQQPQATKDPSQDKPAPDVNLDLPEVPPELK
jgi:hypothetical protein